MTKQIFAFIFYFKSFIGSYSPRPTWEEQEEWAAKRAAGA
jgi:hypothetical protein